MGTLETVSFSRTQVLPKAVLFLLASGGNANPGLTFTPLDGWERAVLVMKRWTARFTHKDASEASSVVDFHPSISSSVSPWALSFL